MAATHGHGNPHWTRDETILALELYLSLGGASVPGPSDPRVITLSEELRALPVHPPEARRETFRNPEGVAFKLQNIRQVATGRGLQNVSAMDEAVWSVFGSDVERVQETARAIREAGRRMQDNPAVVDIEDDEVFAEGKLLTRIHKSRERRPEVRQKLIEARRDESGQLRCDACGRNPRLRDPALNESGFEAHHVLPLANSGEHGRETRLKDMALLCATCHRILHRAIQQRGDWLTVDEFKQSILGRTATGSTNE